MSHGYRVHGMARLEAGEKYSDYFVGPLPRVGELLCSAGGDADCFEPVSSKCWRVVNVIHLYDADAANGMRSMPHVFVERAKLDMTRNRYKAEYTEGK